MKIKAKDLFHGSALTQIVEHPLFKALNKVEEVDKKYGHYQINHNKRLLVKHAKNEKPPWKFTLQPDDINTVVGDIISDQEAFLCLVCGKETICILTTEDFENLIDTNSKTAQWVKVESPAGSGMRVSGTSGASKSIIPHNSFPKKLFENEA